MCTLIYLFLRVTENNTRGRSSKGMSGSAMLGSLKMLWNRFASSKQTLLSLEGKELLVFQHSQWVYDIEARGWLQLDLELVPPFLSLEGSRNGLVCVSGYEALAVTNPLHHASVQLPKFDEKPLKNCKCVVPYDVEEATGRFKLLVVAELGDSEEVCKLYDSMTDKWVRTESMPMKWDYGMFQHQKVAGASGRIYFATAEGGVIAYNTRSGSWEVVVDALPGGLITNRVSEVLQRAHKRGMDCVMPQPNLFEFGGQLMLVGQAVSIENEGVKEHVAIWKLDKESRAWTELTRVSAGLWSAIVSAAVGGGMRQIWTVVSEGRVFISSTHLDTMAMCDLNTLQWEWLPRCPLNQWFLSRCAYRPNLRLKREAY